MFILITPYKFTQFSYINYELDIFKKKLKEKFEIHDLSNIINPSWNHAFKLKRHHKAKTFLSINQWERYFLSLKKKDNNIVVMNELDLNSISSLIIQFKLSKYCNNIIQFKAPGIPNRTIETKTLTNFDNFGKKIFKILNIKISLFYLKKKFLNICFKLIKFKNIYVICCGNKKNYTLNLNAKKVVLINFHFRDYSRLLFYNIKKKKNKKSNIIFLDTPGPYFTDDFDLFQKKTNYRIEKWYEDLNNFLLKVEKKFSSKVVIVPHPKVKNSHNPYYNKKFNICRDMNAVHKLIPNSKLVISINGSTAIGIAIATKKPIVLIYNDQQKKFNNELFNDLNFISQKCGSKLININNYDINKLYNKVDESIYRKYFYDYISTKKISKKRNYQILNNLIHKIKNDKK